MGAVSIANKFVTAYTMESIYIKDRNGDGRITLIRNLGR